MKMFKTTLFSTLLIFCITISAQNTVEVIASSEVVGVTNKSFETLIYNSTLSDIEKSWKDLMKDYDGKVKKSKREIISTETQVPLFGSAPQNIYFRTYELNDSVAKIIIAIEVGTDYIDPSGANSDGAKSFIRTFAFDHSKTKTNNKLENKERENSKLSSKKRQLERENEKLEKNLKKWKKSIEEAELKLKENIADQKSIDAAIIKSEKAVKSTQTELNSIR
jgi:SMC interacting uncharacterized protein involved in chromosome segregation